MVNKKYKKGVQDASDAYAAFGKKQTEALEHILGEIRNGNCTLEEAVKKLGAIGGNVENLYKYLKGKEKAQLYSVYTPLDIADLDKEEKLFLVGVLFRLTIDKLPTEAQQKFIRSVQRYLDIKEPPFGVDITAIEEIESMNAQKAIYQVVLEYLMLQDGDSFDETEIQHTLLESFNLNNKNRQIIEEHVRLLYIATGADGFVEKYGFVDDAEDFEDGADEAETIKSESIGKESEEDNFVEEYEGIPLKLAEELCQKKIGYSAFGTAFNNDDKYFETRSYSIVYRYLHGKYVWVCYDKNRNEKRILSSLLADEFFGVVEDSNFGKGDSGYNYVIDYQNDIMYLNVNGIFYRIEINNDDKIQIKTEFPEGNLDLDENIVLISGRSELQYFDLMDYSLHTIVDSCGKNIEANNTSVIVGRKIYFYATNGMYLSDDNGNGWSGSIFIYDLDKHSVKKIIDLNDGYYIRSIFKRNNIIYLLGTESGTETLKKIARNDTEYCLETLWDDFSTYAGLAKTIITHNWFCSYKYAKSSYKDTQQSLYSIAIFDFSKQISNMVVTDCEGLTDEGVFKPKWVSIRSDYKVIGQWLYYIKDGQSLDLIHRKMDRFSQIYRVNLNFPSKPVCLGNA